MAQHDYVIANGTGAAVRSDLNNGLAAIVSQNSGATEPATMYAYQWWADTTTGLLKIRNSANNAWVTVGTLASANLGLAALASPTFTGTVTAPTFTASTAVNIPLGSAGSPTLFFTGDSNTGLFSPGADTIAFAEGGVESMRIDSSGRLGIGTTSPDTNSQLHIVGSSYQPLYVNTTGAGGGGAVFFRSGTQALVVGTGGSAWLTGSSTADGLIRSEANLIFATGGNNQRAQIDSSGRLLVGTSTVFSGSGINPLVTISKSAGSGLGISEIGAGEVGLGTNPSGNHSYYAGFFLNSSGTGVGSITVGSSSTAYVTSSDYRLKENVTPVSDGITRLQQLKPSRFNFKADSSHTVDGFIAHEAQAVVPECVTGTKDEVDADGNPVYQGIDQSKLVPLLTAALQEAIGEIESLKARVVALESA